jgi:hypothetical protein
MLSETPCKPSGRSPRPRPGPGMHAGISKQAGRLQVTVASKHACTCSWPPGPATHISLIWVMVLQQAGSVPPTPVLCSHLRGTGTCRSHVSGPQSAQAAQSAQTASNCRHQAYSMSELCGTDVLHLLAATAINLSCSAVVPKVRVRCKHQHRATSCPAYPVRGIRGKDFKELYHWVTGQAATIGMTIFARN